MIGKVTHPVGGLNLVKNWGLPKKKLKKNVTRRMRKGFRNFRKGQKQVQDERH